MTATPDQRMAVTRDFMTAANRLPILWDLGADWNRLIALYEDPDSDQDKIADELDKLAGDIKAKAYGVAVVLDGLDKLAELQRAEAKRFTDKARATEAHIDRTKAYVLACMQSMSVERIETGIRTLSVRQNPLSVQVIDAAAIPHEFERTKIETTVDKRAILDAFKRDGEVVPGVELVRGVRLEVR